MTASLGASSCNSPSCLAAKSPTVWTTPVTLPPGRLRLTTKPVLTGSKTGGEDDRDRRSGRFGDRRRKSVGHDHGDLAADELRRHRRKPIIPILGKAILGNVCRPSSTTSTMRVRAAILAVRYLRDSRTMEGLERSRRRRAGKPWSRATR